jgi:hypothetical protein
MNCSKEHRKSLKDSNIDNRKYNLRLSIFKSFVLLRKTIRTGFKKAPKQNELFRGRFTRGSFP